MIISTKPMNKNVPLASEKQAASQNGEVKLDTRMPTTMPMGDMQAKMHITRK
jgi:hypothetical protein